MSLSDAKNRSWISLFQLEVARVLAAQLVIAVDYIHSQGFVYIFIAAIFSLNSRVSSIIYPQKSYTSNIGSRYSSQSID
jgi:hypothetical protein